MRANETYSEAKRARNMDVLMNAQSPHKWWSVLKSAVFGLSSSLPPFVGEGAVLVCESVWPSWSALGSFCWQAVRRDGWSAAHMSSISKSNHLCVQVEWGEASLVRLGPIWCHWHIGELVRHCRRSLVKVVDWCVSRLAWLICCRIILTASSQGRLLISRSLTIHLRDLPSLPSGRESSGVSC